MIAGNSPRAREVRPHMKKPTNTAKFEVNTPALFGGDPRWIVAQEERGAEEAAASESLPSNINDKPKWEALGFIFGEPFPDDGLFCPATMPPGWSKRRTDHHMHTDIIDAAGNTRGSFFYKAAFYDRDAILYPPLKRYTVTSRLRADGDYYTKAANIVMDVVDRVTGDALFSAERTVTATSPDSGGDRRAWHDERESLEDEASTAAKSWLAEHYPDHEDPGAYWPSAEAK